MNICFSYEGWKDYLHFQETDKKIVKRINFLIKEIIRDPTGGTGKQEQLKHDLKGFWSRRITQSHRLVYTIDNDRVVIIQCRYHY